MLQSLDAKESREAQEIMQKILDKNSITKYNAVEEINDKIKPMGHEIYKDNKECDYYAIKVTHGMTEVDEGL